MHLYSVELELELPRSFCKHIFEKGKTYLIERHCLYFPELLKALRILVSVKASIRALQKLQRLVMLETSILIMVSSQDDPFFFTILLCP